MVIDARICPSNISCASRNFANILFDLFSVAVLLPVLLQVHPMLGVDVADVAHLSS